MSISWISSTTFVIGIFPEYTFLISLKDDEQIDVVSRSHTNCSIYESITSLDKLDTDGLNGEGRVKDLSWTACAAKADINKNKQFVLTGTRSGGLYLYQLSNKSYSTRLQPVCNLDRCHGRGGVTAIGVVPASQQRDSYIITAGRLHGSVRRWRVMEGCRGETSCTLEPLDQILKPSGLTWVAAFTAFGDEELLALGFSSVNFCAVEIVSSGMGTINSNGKLHFTVQCAGGNRVWDFACLTTPSSAPNHLVFAAIQRDRIFVSTCYLNGPASKNGLTNTVFLVTPLHGRDINACLLIPHHPIKNPDSLTEAGPNSKPFCTCLTASEDIQIGSFSLIVKEKNLNGDAAYQTLYNKFYVTGSSPRFHSGHISNIRCLSQVEPSSSLFVLSGGGRGMLAVWRLDNNRVPGLVGWVRLDTSMVDDSPIPSCPVKGLRRLTKSAVDLRVMALLGFERTLGEELLIIVGCSDGSLRLLRAVLPCETTHWQLKFNQICIITNEIQTASADNKASCILTLLLLSHTNDRNIQFAYSNTAGKIQGYRVNLDTLVVEPIFSGRIEVRNPVTGTLGSCAANSIAADGELMVVGGDDASLRLARISGNQIVWTGEQKRHYAAVVRVAILPVYMHLLSLGSDQRLLLWSTDTAAEVLNLISELTIPGIGDPHDMQILPAPDNHKTFFVMVTGSGLQLCVVST